VKQRKVQNSFLSGVLDPRASARVGTDAYANGLLIGRNVIPVHLGGVRRRPGMRFIERLSYQLTFNTPTATAPNGGTAANAYDDDTSTLVTTTTEIQSINPYVVVRYDMGATISPRHIDINRIRLSVGNTDELMLQYSTDDSTWVTVAAMYVDTDAKSYRFTPLTGDNPIPARYWRIARIGSTDLDVAVCSVGEFNVWTETSTVSAVRHIPFELNTEQQYMVVLTDRSGFIYQDGELIPGGYFSTPYESADLAEVGYTVGADALFLVHEDYAPRFLIYDDTGLGYNEFQTDEVVFSYVPQHDYNDATSPAPTSAVQEITFSSGWLAGDALQIELDGARTGSIAYAGDSTADEQAATAANIAREVQKLYTVPGFDGVTCARTGALEYTVTFAGASARPYGLMSVIPLITDGTATATAAVVSTATGVSREEDVWSASRGYPRNTAFFEGRWYFFGTRSLPKSWFGSAVNNILYFNTDQALDGDALAGTFDGGNIIVGAYPGRSLQLFTTAAEFRFIKQVGEPITPSDIPRKQTEYGSAKIPPVNIDGATIFVQKNLKSIRDFKFDINEDSYNSLSLSSLAPHLINGIVDLAAWNGSRTDEINLVFVVNGDGTVAVLNTRREAEVTAWTQWITGANATVAEDGTVSGHDEIKAVGVVGQDIYFSVERMIGGESVLYLEVADEDMRMDAAVLKDYIAPESNYLVAFLATDPLIGEECRATIDGMPVDNVTPELGSIAVTIASSYAIDADTEVRIGLNFDTTVRPMPLNTVGADGGAGLIGKQRIVKGKIKVRNTLGLRMNGRVLPEQQFDLINFDEVPTPYTGNLVLEESTNWDETEDKIVTFDQVDPLPMEILGIEMVMEGGS
jgi:hypothetical protein